MRLVVDREMDGMDVVRELVWSIGLMAIGFVLAAAVNVALDTMYVLWKSNQRLDEIGLSSLAPLNNFLYNVDSDNLAKHGLHPRYLHAAVNMQLLFGPWWIWCLYKLSKNFKARQGKTGRTIFTSGATVLLALSLLSAIPHQEPRFLLPLLLPISLLYNRVFADSFRMKALWVVVNMSVAAFFGFVHQAGIIPLLLREHNSACVFSYETYTIPQFLLGNRDAIVINLKGHDQQERLELVGMCDNSVLLLPSTALPDLDGIKSAFSVQLAQSWWPHFCGERLGTEFELLMLRIDTSSGDVIGASP